MGEAGRAGEVRCLSVTGRLLARCCMVPYQWARPQLWWCLCWVRKIELSGVCLEGNQEKKEEIPVSSVSTVSKWQECAEGIPLLCAVVHI